MIIDELDAKLHPKLLRYVISLFKNRKVNRNGAQLLFTTHDMATMKNTVFRRDEIWFAASDGYGTAKDVPTSTGKCKLLVDISCANSISGVVVSPSLFCYNGNHKITVLSADT